MSEEQELEAEVAAVQAADEADQEFQERVNNALVEAGVLKDRRDQNADLLTAIGGFIIAVHGVYSGDNPAVIGVIDQAVAAASKVLKEIEES